MNGWRKALLAILAVALATSPIHSQTRKTGDGVYSPPCSDESANVSVQRNGPVKLQFTNNSGKMLAVWKIYPETLNATAKGLNPWWAAGSSFTITLLPDHPFAYRMIVIDAKQVGKAGEPRNPCHFAALQMVYEQHVAMCDQISGGPGCRVSATPPRE
jgi:hypothetical protein